MEFTIKSARFKDNWACGGLSSLCFPFCLVVFLCFFV
jgi:hypothetical protein